MHPQRVGEATQDRLQGETERRTRRSHEDCVEFTTCYPRQHKCLHTLVRQILVDRVVEQLEGLDIGIRLEQVLLNHLWTLTSIEQDEHASAPRRSLRRRCGIIVDTCRALIAAPIEWDAAMVLGWRGAQPLSPLLPLLLPLPLLLLAPPA